MFRKIKKIFPSVISAVLCLAMALSVTVSADGSANLWKEAKSLTSAKYNSKYIKWLEKYSEKETKNTVAYSKSRTKKFLDKVEKTLDSDDLQFLLCLVNKNTVYSYSVKGDNCKMVAFQDKSGMAAYVKNNEAYLLSIKNKLKAVSESDSKSYAADLAKTVSGFFDFKINENEKGKIFKFKIDEKICYYEEFDGSGFIFNEKGTPLAAYIDGEAYCISFKTAVDDSEFYIPKSYKTVSFDEFEF